MFALVERKMHLEAERIGEVGARPPPAGELGLSGSEHDCRRRKLRYGFVAANGHALAIERDRARAGLDVDPARTRGIEQGAVERGPRKARSAKRKSAFDGYPAPGHAHAVDRRGAKCGRIDPEHAGLLARFDAEEFAADFGARAAPALEQDDRRAVPRKPDRGGAAGRAAADHNRVGVAG